MSRPCFITPWAGYCDCAPMAKVAPEASETEDCILSAFESGMGGMLGEGITTVTFFNGDVKAAAEYLKQRLALSQRPTRGSSGIW